MENINSRIDELLKKYKQGNCTPAEQALVEHAYNLASKSIGNNLERFDYEPIENEIRARISSSLKGEDRGAFKGAKIITLRRIAVAASVLLCMLLGGYFLINKPSSQENPATSKNDIAPGGNKAILTLANGAQIALNDAANGSIATQEGIAITKTADGQLIYTITDAKNTANSNKSNTIATPKGGQWQVHLPDGTKVWLNAASSLTYPPSFASLKERRVELNGEAYFEVAKDKQHPFKVKSQGQEIEVLGTHFNVNSYADEANVKTTLLEGSVKIKQLASSSTAEAANQLALFLKPGQCATLTAATGNIKIANVDTQEAIAWKMGYFMFDHEDLSSIMQKISRWYNVDVVYKNQEIKTEPFWGKINRFGNVSEVLKMLELTGEVHFKIENKKIIVSK